ncbi:uncharacterized protein LOC132293301 isoform X2 [Cornus florida]|uniref:uncharacterized protein LOC132293301 isoform X2 n=1 Tax=Cornus florida TaxID=4283 RepID=UPI00289B0527|nr:uncharacterized protein LOC132293301 isoform X2 [Cornus florida]
MEEAIEVDVETTIAAESCREKGNKKTMRGRQKKAHAVSVDGENLPGSEEDLNNGPPRITVLEFDYSVESHFRAVDTICKLCGDAECNDFYKYEIERLSSSVTFVREWSFFNYQPRIVRVACQSDSPLGKDVIGEMHLPQFSAAAVPKERQTGNATPPELSKDFVMHVGGPVWALDWRPRVHERSDSNIKCEYIAIATHPPESCYHKIGAPLTGIGVIQVWCLLNVLKAEEVPPQVNERPKQSNQPKKPRGRPRKKPINEPVDNLDCNNQYLQATALQFPEEMPTQVMIKPKQNPSNSETVKVKPIQPKKPRGRPRKKPINESVDNLDCNNQYVQALAIQFPKDSSELPPGDEDPMDTREHVAKKDTGRKRKGAGGRVSADDSALTISVDRTRSKAKARKGSHDQGNDLPSLVQNENNESSLMETTPSREGVRLKEKARKGSDVHGNGLTSVTQYENNESSLAYPQTSSSCGQDPVGSSDNAAKCCSFETSLVSGPVLKDVALPRMVLCLYHNGKVAWDVKWRPSNVYDAESKHRMGYLAVLLGNGALEVWEVPFPRTIKAIYSAHQKEGADPRFLKLEPVFRCSRLKCGDRQSIPLTVEWSASSPHDFILAGCHDGVVALWKFSASDPSKDTRPLLCFSADTVPIRALAWAPDESDPFQPLRDLNPVQRVIYSLDWLPDPRCVIVSYDDGTLRILSLVKSACDVPVTGKPFVGKQQQGFHSYYCSSFTIWSVQVSRLTGMVAYCSADGTVLRFQLTTRAVEKDPLRNRAPHFLCGSLIEEESGLTVINPLPDTPFPMKKSLNEWSNTPRTMRGFLAKSNQAKRAMEQMAKDQTSDDQSQVPSKKSKQTPKSKKKPEADLALVCRDVEPDNVQRDDYVKGEVGNEFEVFPPKIIAMHRVRWNMNRGSERWLCYGGAAGIVRCQEI